MIHEVIKESFLQETTYPVKNSFFISFLIMSLKRRAFVRSWLPYLSREGREGHINAAVADWSFIRDS